LIVDEVLAVGDNAFQRKCLGKISEINRSGRTVIFVSHNMATVLNLCEKVAVLHRGQLRFFGDSKEGAAMYVRENKTSVTSTIDLSSHSSRRSGCPTILGRARLLDAEGHSCDQFQSGDPMSIELELAVDCAPEAYHVAVGFDDEIGRRLFTVATYLSSSANEPDPNIRRWRCRLDSLSLAPGRYGLSFNAGPRGFFWRDFIDQAMWIDVQPSDYYKNGRTPNPEWGDFLVRSNWSSSCNPQ
jgi:lipopolysaccharide transport system ATP-binding protein